MDTEFNVREFSNMSIDKQVSIFNSMLKETSLSVTKLCKNIGINKNTLVARFSKNNYQFKYATKEYVLNTPNDVKDDVKKSNIKSNTHIDNKSIDTSITQCDYEHLKNEIKMLKNELDEIKSSMNNNMTNSVNDSIDNNCIIDIDLCGDKSLTRNIRMYKTVSNNLVKLHKQYDMFRVQDLINTAINEYCKKYLK